MKLLYFAWLREKIGMAREDANPPEDITTVEELIHWQAQRGGGFEVAFADLSVVRVAVNQEYVAMDHVVKEGDEIAFFPPVTGG